MITVPGSTFTGIIGVNNRGEIIGSYNDSNFLTHAFLDDNGAFTTIDLPGATATTPAAINNSGEIVGNYVNSTGTHGFVYDHGSFTTVDAPGATSTTLAAINGGGDIAGAFSDSNRVEHAFLASATGRSAASVTLNDLLTGHAAQISMSDILPGVPAKGGQSGSAQGIDLSGLVDNSTGGSFGAIVHPGSADASAHVMPNVMDNIFA